VCLPRNSFGSSRFRRGRTELKHFSPFMRRDPLHWLRKLDRYVKLNYFCHGSVPSIPALSSRTRRLHCYHSHPHSQRMDSALVFSEAPYTTRMTSSTYYQRLRKGGIAEYPTSLTCRRVYFSFTNSSTKIAHTPTVMGNCTKDASRSVPPLGRRYVRSSMARAVNIPRASLFQFMRVQPRSSHFEGRSDCIRALVSKPKAHRPLPRRRRA